MGSAQDMLTLTRLARKYPDQREIILKLMEQELLEVGAEDSAPNPEGTQPISENGTYDFKGGGPIQNETIHAELVKPSSMDSPVDQSISGVTYPLEIFHVYGGVKLTGVLHSDRTVQLDGKHYTPSRAAMIITGHRNTSDSGIAVAVVFGSPVNGWTWWKYRDPLSGRTRPIDYLRRMGWI